MKGYSKYIKWVVGFVLALIPILVFCDATPPPASFTPGSTPLWDMFQKLSFVPPVGDKSVVFLAKMFGYMPGVPQFSKATGTIIGTVFGVFNTGILSLSGVFLSYTVVKVCTETAADGGAMGKSTTLWTAVRCSLSTSLLVPTASGYSMINSIIMWVVIQSVGLADMTWSRAMDYLQKGGNVYAAPVAVVDYSLIDYLVTSGDDTIDSTRRYFDVGSADVLRSLTCAYAFRGALQASQDAHRKRLEISGKTSGAEYNATKTLIPEKSSSGFSVYKEDEINGVFQFPYVDKEADKSANPLLSYGLNLDSNFISQLKLTGICGTIGYKVIQKAADKKPENIAAYNERSQRYNSVKRDALIGMISFLEPVAKNLITKIKPNDQSIAQLDASTYTVYTDTNGKPVPFYTISSPTDGVSSKQTSTKLAAMKLTDLPDINWPLGADEMLQAALDYGTALSSVRMAGTNTLDVNKQRQFADAKANGWITAANYYRLLANQQSNAGNEYGSYRLTGYIAQSNPPTVFDEALEKDLRVRDSNELNSYFYDTLFHEATDTSVVVGGGKQSVINVIDKTYADVLKGALTWISLAAPYAKLHGRVITANAVDPSVATGTGVSISGAGSQIDLSGWSGTGVEAGIWIQMIVGSICLVTPYMPFTIPVLMFIPLEWLYFDVNKIFAVWDTNMGDSTKDPIIKLQNVGNAMIESAIAYMKHLQAFYMCISLAIGTASIIVSLLSFAIAPGSFWGTTTGFSMSAETLTEVYHTVLDMSLTIIYMYIPIAIAALGPIFVSGIIFAIYVPLIPYLLFLFGAISWFISVLVLMAAAPIICFLMLGWGGASQDNPLLSREAEQFVMQIIGVFFRPTLMVIGLVTGMVLSYIGVDLLNLGFAKIVELIVTSSNNNVKLVQQVGVIIIYTFTMVSIVNMCFSTIHLLYSEAMRVAGISAPALGLEEKSMEAVKGGVSQFGEAGAGGIKEGSQSGKGSAKMKGGMGAADRKAMEERKEKEEAKQSKMGASGGSDPGSKKP